MYSSLSKKPKLLFETIEDIYTLLKEITFFQSKLIFNCPQIMDFSNDKNSFLDSIEFIGKIDSKGIPSGRVFCDDWRDKKPGTVEPIFKQGEDEKIGFIRGWLKKYKDEPYATKKDLVNYLENLINY